MPHNDPGPQSPGYLYSEIPGSWNVATDIGELASRQNGVPVHRRPGSAMKAVPKNGNANALPGRGD